MVRTERDKKREIRKLNILDMFVGNERLYTNTVARKLGVVWPTADRLLQELVDEGRLTGDKIAGYVSFIEPERVTFWKKVKWLLHAR